jgi:hypothetical protein
MLLKVKAPEAAVTFNVYPTEAACGGRCTLQLPFLAAILSTVATSSIPRESVASVVGVSLVLRTNCVVTVSPGTAHPQTCDFAGVRWRIAFDENKAGSASFPPPGVGGGGGGV